MVMEQMVARLTVITPKLATAASMLVKLAHPGDSSLHRALLKAEPLLMTQPWRIAGGILQIVSASQQNETHKTDGDYCECPTTRGVCWHRAAWMMLSTLAAAGIDPIADLPLPAVTDDDELPASSSFLDGPFDAFEDMSLLGAGHDEYGDIIVPAMDTRLIGDARAGDDWWDEVQSQDAPGGPFPTGQRRADTPALDTRVYFDEVVLPEPVAPVAPFRPGPARTMAPAAGSDWARAQARGDELFAA